MRIEEVEGIGPTYATKLEAAGVRSADDLLDKGAKPSGRRNLATTIQEVVAARPSVVRRTPSEGEIQGWINQSKGLTKIVEH